MIGPLSDLSPGAPLRTQVAVVGSGLAGVEVATFLAARGHQVTVLESGGEGFDARAEALNEVEFVGRPHRRYGARTDFHEYLPPEYRGRNRLRQLGGTSTVWTGKWRAFERRDFEPRPWVPWSGWPLSYEEMAAAYAEVSADYRLGFGADGRVADDLPELREALGAAGFKTVPFFQEAGAYRSSDRLRAALGDAGGGGLRVLLDATVVRLELAPGADRVGEVVCRALDGTERRVAAGHVVLAAGGLEVPRILLASNDRHPAGLGNGRDLVGRFYQDHLKINRARFVPGPLLRRLAGAVQTRPRPRTTLCIGLPDAEQERLGVLEASLFLQPNYVNRLGQARALLSGRRPVRDGHGAVGRYTAKFTLEQAPAPESRVRLSRDRDALGVPKLVIDWRLGPLDRHGFETSLREIARRTEASGLGRLDCGGAPNPFEDATDSAHHMGTTRMGAGPHEGVVDRDCTVFGIPNLHVASSSVFPTGAGYSPSLTILALSRRVARQVDAALGRPAAATGPARGAA